MVFLSSTQLIPLLLATNAIIGSHAHGQIEQVVADGLANTGPNIYYAEDAKNSKTAIRMMYPASGQAYVLPSGFSDNSQMSCEGSASAPVSMSIKAGSTLSIFWEGATGELRGKPGTGSLTAYNPWVHAMGPIQDFMTSCGAAGCAKFDTSNAGWTKIAGMGIDAGQSVSPDLRATMKGKPEAYYPTGNGLWAIAKMVQQGSKWDVQIPSSLSNGEYIVRHELSAVHSPKKAGDAKSGPQLYIACIQVKVTEGGNATLPAGTQAGKLYDANGDFANFNVYDGKAAKFNLPGPAIWSGVSEADTSEQPASSLSSVAQTAVISTPSPVAITTPTTTPLSTPAENATTVTSSSLASAATSTRTCKSRRNVRAPALQARRAQAAHRRRSSSGIRRL